VLRIKNSIPIYDPLFPCRFNYHASPFFTQAIFSRHFHG